MSWIISQEWEIWCFYRDVAGDSSVVGYYVVYCLIPKKKAGISFETLGIIYSIINIYHYLLIIE